MNKKKSYLLLAPLPLPIGGVTIHCFRLAHWLLNNGYECAVCDLSGGDSSRARKHIRNIGGRVFGSSNFFSMAAYLYKYRNSGNLVINVHSKKMLVLMLAILIRTFIRDVELVITLHSFRTADGMIKHVVLKSLIWVFNRSDRVIVTNLEILRILERLGCDAGKVHVSHTYLPPVEEEKFGDIGNGVKEFLEDKYPILSANAYKLSFYNNQDLYGLDICIAVTDLLRKKGYNVGFVFALPELGDRKYYYKMMKTVDELDLKRNFFVRQEVLSLIPLISLSHAFLRPTNTDGDSISVREAIAIGVPAIASDCVDRPPGAILFKTRDVYDLADKICEYVLQDSNEKPSPKIGGQGIVGDSVLDIPQYILTLCDDLQSQSRRQE